ncbi:hypothetical protein [Mucilaginibacter celer]|uniref:Uncharacterized protein n=1 Tax=Mucilaginibacter celer TaxID=2305508 RepID=A0A494VKD2_9SPHI|nr:hypothetical protein [Mucilaginibacter celer]AYL95607.1 hypothetical protein HYN43_010030 [Mucilaginibacter celer]
MSIPFKTRELYPEEVRLLKTFKAQRETDGFSKIRYYHFLIAALLGGCFTYLAVLTQDSFWVLPFGTIAVFAFAFIVFTPYEIYKWKKKNGNLLNELNIRIDKGTVDTFIINAKRIAVVKEYDDEGDLFIIEYEPDKLIYLWDYDYNLQKRFPCLEFEIYEESFSKLSGRQVYPLSERIAPIVIEKNAKRNYLDKFGVPGNLEIVEINFDKLVADYADA